MNLINGQSKQEGLLVFSFGFLFFLFSLFSFCTYDKAFHLFFFCVICDLLLGEKNMWFFYMVVSL